MAATEPALCSPGALEVAVTCIGRVEVQGQSRLKAEVCDMNQGHKFLRVEGKGTEGQLLGWNMS